MAKAQAQAKTTAIKHCDRKRERQRQTQRERERDRKRKWENHAVLKHWSRGGALGVSSKINGTDPQHHGLTTSTENQQSYPRSLGKNISMPSRCSSSGLFGGIMGMALSLSQDNTSGLKAILVARSSGQDIPDIQDDAVILKRWTLSILRQQSCFFLCCLKPPTFSDTV